MTSSSEDIASTPNFFNEPFIVADPATEYSEEFITAQYNYRTTKVRKDSNGNIIAVPQDDNFIFKTERRVPKTGIMLVGWGGCNGSTVTAGIIANRLGLQWNTKEGPHKADYLGSLTQSATVRLGLNDSGESVYIPFSRMLPLVHPNDLVLDFDLQRQLYDHMQPYIPLPSIFDPRFIAANQADRADHIITG
eukprot:gene29364-38446_t